MPNDLDSRASEARRFRNGFILGSVVGILIGVLGGYVVYDLLAARQVKQRTSLDACIEHCHASGRSTWTTPTGKESDCFTLCTLVEGARGR
jgi:hypothetical protein